MEKISESHNNSYPVFLLHLWRRWLAKGKTDEVKKLLEKHPLQIVEIPQLLSDIISSFTTIYLTKILNTPLPIRQLLLLLCFNYLAARDRITTYYKMTTEATNSIDETTDGESLYQRLVLKIDKGQEPMRVDKFLTARIEYATRNKIQLAIDAGMVTVNGKAIKSNYKIKPADEIIVYTDQEPNESDIIPEPMDLNIVYEDEHLLVINKQAGMVVHPGSGNYSGTLINGVAHYLIQKDPTLTDKLLPRFGLVHRIDKNTTGLLLLAKTDKALQDLAKQFFHHSIDRKYVALVWGDMEQNEGTIKAHVGRNIRHRKLFEAYPEGEHGKDAITHYKVLERFHYVTLVECVLETGRTHQIRVHMKHIGHTLFNDETYGGDRILKGTVYTKYKQFVDNCFSLCPRQALHAKTLGFKHPATDKYMLFESDIPNDIASVIEKWRKYYLVKGKVDDVI